MGMHGHSAWPPAGQLEIRQNRQSSIENHLFPRTLGSYRILSFSETSLFFQQRDRSGTNMCDLACEHCCPEVWPRSQRRTSAVACSDSDLLHICLPRARPPPPRAQTAPSYLQRAPRLFRQDPCHEDKFHNSSCPHRPWPRTTILQSGVAVQGDGKIRLNSSSISSNDIMNSASATCFMRTPLAEDPKSISACEPEAAQCTTALLQWLGGRAIVSLTSGAVGRVSSLTHKRSRLSLAGVYLLPMEGAFKP